MDAASFYSTIEKLSLDIVPTGPRQEDLLSEIAASRAEHPDEPPAKHLLALLTEAADKSRISAENGRAIRDIAFHWV
jgi:hypothetical protein